MNAARRLPWVALGMGLLGALALVLGPILKSHPWVLRPCLFKTLTGFACATCGLTRCSLALLEGRPWEAIHWHPVAALLLFASPLLAAWDIRRAIRGEPYPSLPDRRAPRLALALILAATWILQIARGI
jgi:hypothetical protein